MLVIGLTGGIGSGKTTASEFLRELGAVVLDADSIGHEAYNPGTETWNDVVNAFGREILQDSGEIDRRKLGSIVFNDDSLMKRLTDIMWPRIYDIVKEKVEEQRISGVDVVVVEAAVLLEANWISLVDEVWVITASEDTVIRRLKDNKGMIETEVRSRIESQMCIDDRLSRADFVISNNHEVDTLKERITDTWQRRVGNKG